MSAIKDHYHDVIEAQEQGLGFIVSDGFSFHLYLPEDGQKAQDDFYRILEFDKNRNGKPYIETRKVSKCHCGRLKFEEDPECLLCESIRSDFTHESDYDYDCDNDDE